uniref:Pectinesterase n=1 Tax=Fagus sylvatica TaxID=28930 RepID=A0A2N9EF21_FAGSY
MHVDTIVALDGTGHYRTITEAILAAPSHSNRRYVIYVKKGVYKENIDMKKKKTNIMLAGDGMGQTIVTGNRNFMQGWTTFRTPTVAVSGKGFIARDMTFCNTAGPETHQDVALRVDSDQSAFYRCSMEGHQDTLYAHSLRQFYRECNIYGTIDFIFVQPRGWLEWCGDFALSTLWYGEYRNYGPGASLSGWVNWTGYHIIQDAATVAFFTVGRFIDGSSWLPNIGVKFTAGLSN